MLKTIENLPYQSKMNIFNKEKHFAIYVLDDYAGMNIFPKLNLQILFFSSPLKFEKLLIYQNSSLLGLIF